MKVWNASMPQQLQYLNWVKPEPSSAVDDACLELQVQFSESHCSSQVSSSSVWPSITSWILLGNGGCCAEIMAKELKWKGKNNVVKACGHSCMRYDWKKTASSLGGLWFWGFFQWWVEGTGSYDVRWHSPLPWKLLWALSGNAVILSEFLFYHAYHIYYFTLFVLSFKQNLSIMSLNWCQESVWKVSCLLIPISWSNSWERWTVF